MISSISSFDIVSVVDEERLCPLTKIFLCISASAADVNPKGIKTLLDIGWMTFFIKGNPVFSNGPRSLPRNPNPILWS